MLQAFSDLTLEVSTRKPTRIEEADTLTGSTTPIERSRGRSASEAGFSHAVDNDTRPSAHRLSSNAGREARHRVQVAILTQKLADHQEFIARIQAQREAELRDESVSQKSAQPQCA
jgi:hypothetical protein